MSLLRPCPCSTRSITFDRENNLLVGEISSLGVGVTFERVWNDACDEGLTLISHRTGTEVVYAVEDVKSCEGDILYWTLIPANYRERFLPELRLYND